MTRIDDYAIEKIYQDLEEVAIACGVGQMSVWGYSFEGHIARYLGAWSDRVKAIAMIGVPVGRTVQDEFYQYIDEFIEKYGPLAQSCKDGTLSKKKRKLAVKSRIPVLVACFQAMRCWPSIEASEVDCAALLLAGTKNNSVLEWLKRNDKSIERAEVKFEIVEGLTHQQEFSQVDTVYPIDRSFIERS